MKALSVLLVALLANSAALAQGTLFFSNHVPAAGLDAPVFDTDGKTGVLGSEFQAQLYAGSSAGSLSPLGPSAYFGGMQPGYWVNYSPLERMVPDVAPGAAAFVQVKVWSVRTGPSYEQVVAAGGKHGESAIFSVITGGDTKGDTQPPSFPGYLVGLNSFTLTGVDPIMPEPTITWLLGVVGGAWLVWRLRK